MTEIPQTDGRERFVTDISIAIQKRVESAEPIKLLSERDDKLVELVKDTNGYKFVRRTYRPTAIEFIEDSGLSFQEAMDAMRRDFGRAGLEIVPNFVVNPLRNKRDSLIVVSEYLDDAKPVIDASTKTKLMFARRIGGLLIDGQEILPALQMLQKDAFHVVRKQSGEESIVLTDIDPYVIPLKVFESRSAFKDLMTAQYINRISELFYNSWTNSDERPQVLGALVGAIGPIFSKAPGNATLDAFAGLHLKKQAASFW